MPGRQFSSNSYRYGFNGKENDREVASTGSGTQDYGMRIYNPSLGRFLSVDPLTKDYPWYTPYQFAGNLPTKYVDIDGLEEGELVINDPSARIATLTWKKVYYVVTEGVGMVHNISLVSKDEINKTFASGVNTIYTNVLPGSKNKKGEFEKVTPSFKTAYENSDTKWKINIIYEIEIRTVDDKGNPITLDYAKRKITENPQLNGIIKDEMNLSNTKKMPELGPNVPAGAYTSSSEIDPDVIYTNNIYYGAKPSGVTPPTGTTTNEFMSHEIGHNFGLEHAMGDYTQPGLMSNQHNVIKPTITNNVEIINNNLNAIKQQ